MLRFRQRDGKSMVKKVFYIISRYFALRPGFLVQLRQVLREQEASGVLGQNPRRISSPRAEQGILQRRPYPGSGVPKGAPPFQQQPPV